MRFRHGAMGLKVFAPLARDVRSSPRLQLVILHYHFRPGGVRRVIELAMPHLSRALRPPVHEIVLAGGGAPDPNWLDRLRAGVEPIPIVSRVEPALSYSAEQRAAPRVVTRRLRSFFEGLFGDAAGAGCLVWAHNQGLGRNPLLTRELVRACALRGIRLVFHHHDWWFDHRWQRWPEMRRAGFRALSQVAHTLLPSKPNVCHAAINHADFTVLRRHFPRQAHWLPNLAERSPPPSSRSVRAARQWLDDQLETRNAPVWLLPCRLLRRKNIAESLLLVRWLRPAAWLLSTAGISSEVECVYGERLAAAARKHGWPLRLSVLEGKEHNAPAVPELMAASEAVLLTSIQEGFGLPFLEAAAARRPLLCRALPNVAPDLARFGFRFPQCYEDILVDARLFDCPGEFARQSKLFACWLGGLPQAARKLARAPRWLVQRRMPRAMPFSRLTLTAQLEVLAQPVARSWEWCAPLNPFLRVWRRRAAAGRLQTTRWPAKADDWLSGPAYAARFAHLAEASPRPQLTDSLSPRTGRARNEGAPAELAQASVDCQHDFIRMKLRPEFLYPLLWSNDS